MGWSMHRRLSLSLSPLFFHLPRLYFFLLNNFDTPTSRCPSGAMLLRAPKPVWPHRVYIYTGTSCARRPAFFAAFVPPSFLTASVIRYKRGDPRRVVRTIFIFGHNIFFFGVCVRVIVRATGRRSGKSSIFMEIINCTACGAAAQVSFAGFVDCICVLSIHGQDVARDKRASLSSLESGIVA